jgi:hypothetical protein
VVTDDVVVPAGSAWSRSLIRRADGDLSSSERLVGELAVTPLP